MRILVTADTIGGVWIYARELVTGLLSRGFDVVLVSLGNIPSAEQTQWMKGLSNLDYRPTTFKLEWMQGCMDDLRASAEYLEAVAEETKPDLLHLNQFYYGGLMCDVPRLVVAHSDVVSWWVAVHGCQPPDSAWTRWYRQVVQNGVLKATAVVAPSHWMLKQVTRYYAQPLQSSVIHNGRTPSLFNPSQCKEQLITTAGRLWDEGKNTSLLVRRQLPWPVCVAGADRHPGAELESIAKECTSGVQFERQKSQEELCQLLSRTSIYAAVSRYEPFGLAPVEAALSGCAIVASDIESFCEIWGKAAVFFRNDDAESLCLVLTDLVKNPGLRQSYADRAYDHALQWFNADRMVRQYLHLYSQLLSEKSVSQIHRESWEQIAG
jgi:glycogen(starch) synthase